MRAFDLVAALALLSRLPAPIDHARAAARGARAAWAYPVIGLGLGALSGAVVLALSAVGVAPGPAVAMALGAALLLTGAMHEDGLADAADGLGGGRDRAAALEIMKDSRVGVYGAAAVALALLARWSALATLAAAEPALAMAAMAAAGAVSRAGMGAALAVWPSARREGLSAAQGRAPAPTGGVALLLGLLAAAALCGPGASFGAVAWPIVTSAWIAATVLPGLFYWYAARRLGGQTGDVLGAGQQISEVVFLTALTAI